MMRSAVREVLGDAGFATWMYKDVGRQGVTSVRPDSPYGELVAEFVAKKRRPSRRHRIVVAAVWVGGTHDC